jgi:general secretion pathway protein J
MPLPPARHAHAPRRPRGFTLIEVMVALFILAVVAAMAWQGVDAVIRTREISQQRMDRLLRLQSVLAQWEIDLHEIIDTQVVPGLNFDGATLRLTRRQSDGVQVVAWTLRGGALHRWHAPTALTLEALQEAWMRSYQLLGNEPDTLPMLAGVAQWQLFYFHTSSNSWSNAQSSGDVVDATSQQPAVAAPAESGASATGMAAPAAVVNRDALPDGVRVIVRFGDDGTAAGTLTRDLRLIHP